MYRRNTYKLKCMQLFGRNCCMQPLFDIILSYFDFFTSLSFIFQRRILYRYRSHLRCSQWL